MGTLAEYVVDEKSVLQGINRHIQEFRIQGIPSLLLADPPVDGPRSLYREAISNTEHFPAYPM